MLDMGSGWGEFINNIQGNRKIGMDLNADTRQYLDPSVEFLNQDCAGEWPLPDDSLDVVFISNFLEHLPGKTHIEKAFVHIKRCLRPNGRVICIGPNVKYVSEISSLYNGKQAAVAVISCSIGISKTRKRNSYTAIK